MSLGWFIGSMVATHVVGNVVSNVVENVTDAITFSQLNKQSKNVTVNNYTVAANTAVPQLPNGNAQERVIEERYCEYCDGLIPTDRQYISCPRCGAPILRSTRKVQQEMPVQAPPVRKSGYYVQCDGCHNTIRYVGADICRSPVANKAVKSRGYSGHTGEVKCPSCGIFLPHYETNYHA